MLSPSSRRAWIEIWAALSKSVSTAVALLAEGVDRNLGANREETTGIQSPSSRRAWIEIEAGQRNTVSCWMSPSSRRAWIEIKNADVPTFCDAVALLAEGVDRNRPAALLPRATPVALLAEGVDRNSFAEVEQVMNLQSPSSRRAWIEIPL